MPYLVIGVVVVAALAWVGRNRGAIPAGLWRALLAALIAAVAVAAGLRGLWLPGLALIALSIWLGVNARPAMPSGGAKAGMGVGEARALLGVGEGATRGEVEAAYRRLMLRAHPDHGGTSGLAAQLNAARETLLKQL